MVVIFDRQRLSLTSSERRLVLAPVIIPALTSRVRIRVARPSVLSAKDWGVADTFSVKGIIDLDGIEEYVFAGRATGGSRKNMKGVESEFYELQFSPTWGFFGNRDGMPIRLGERSKSFFQLRVEVDALSGIADTDIEVLLDTLAAPRVAFHSSVAFDAATDVLENSGDGVVSLTHTASGSDRAVFAGAQQFSTAQRTMTSITYAGNAMTEMWDENIGSFRSSAGYRLAGANVTTGAQTVTATAAGSTDELFLGVVSMTGVDSTTPVGTPVTANSLVGGTTATVTVGSVGADDLVVDVVQAANAITVGTDQTQRCAEIGGINIGNYGVSTQLGSAGGVMTWTFADSNWTQGGVAFKPAAGGGAPVGGLIGGKLLHGGILQGRLAR